MKANIFEIQKNSFVDGPGIRTTVFFKGCNLKCKWCHNPESQSASFQIMHYKNICTGCKKCKKVCKYEKCILCGKCVDVCLSGARKVCGKEYSVKEVFYHILEDSLFYELSNGGVTFSGGECMLNIEFLEEILKMCKDKKIHTAVDTAGNVPWQYFERILPYTDMFLYDIKAFSEKLHIEGTGVSNKLIKENLKKLSQSFSGDIIIRIPVIFSFNDTLSEMKKIARFLEKIKYKKIELLEYHSMGEHKYNALDMKFTKYGALDEETLNMCRNVLGLNKK